LYLVNLIARAILLFIYPIALLPYYKIPLCPLL
jgi:hypothetical protein